MGRVFRPQPPKPPSDVFRQLDAVGAAKFSNALAKAPCCFSFCVVQPNKEDLHLGKLQSNLPSRVGYKITASQRIWEKWVEALESRHLPHLTLLESLSAELPPSTLSGVTAYE